MKILDENMDKQRDKYRIRGRDMMAAYAEGEHGDCDCDPMDAE